MAKATGAKQRKTHEKIFAKKTPNDIRWQDVLSLFENLGYTVVPLGGSNYSFWKNGRHITRHGPHPSPQTPAATIRVLKRFLEENGDTPWDKE